MRINVNNVGNADKIEAELARVNGRATRHSYTLVSELQREAEYAEEQLEKFGLQKGARAGARAECESGHALPNAYKYDVNVTLIVLERGSKDWFLTEVRKDARSHAHASSTSIELSKEQIEMAQERTLRDLGISSSSSNNNNSNKEQSQ